MLKSTSFLLRFFLREGPWIVGLQPPRILGQCLWGHPWQEVEEMQGQFPSWVPSCLQQDPRERPGAWWHQRPLLWSPRPLFHLPLAAQPPPEGYQKREGPSRSYSSLDLPPRLECPLWSCQRRRHGQRVVDVLYLPKYGRILNPSLVEGFIPYLEAVSPTHLRDFGPKGILDLSHTDVILVLFRLLPCLFSLLLGLLSLSLGLFDLLQFFLQGNDLLLRGSQLVLGVSEKYPLAFSLPFHVIQSSDDTFSFFLLLQQLTLQLLVAFFSHVEGIHHCYPPPLFLLHLSMGIVHHLLSP